MYIRVYILIEVQYGMGIYKLHILTYVLAASQWLLYFDCIEITVVVFTNILQNSNQA